MGELVARLELRDYQRRAVREVANAYRAGSRAILLVMPTGCHRAGQRVLMHDGSLRAVEDVAVGDLLMGPDSTPRRVLHLCRGEQAMAKIVPTKGDPWVVNLDHVLTLVRTEDGRGKGGALVDVTVRQWLTWSRTKKHLHKLLRVAVEFPAQTTPAPLDPYMLGLYLADGSSRGSFSIFKPDREVHDAVEAFASSLGMRTSLTSAGTSSVGVNAIAGSNRHNPALAALSKLGLRGVGGGAKFVPNTYKLASREARLAVLAGLLDGDGSCSHAGFDFISKSERLANDLAFIARSVGLAAYVAPCEKFCQTGGGGTYYRVSISGDCSVIPTRIARKQATARRQKKDVLRTGFSVDLLDEEPFFGFTLEGDGRYLLDDFTVTHNSGKTVTGLRFGLGALDKGKRVLWLAHRRELVQQAAGRLARDGVPHGVIYDGEPSTDPSAAIQVASVWTVAQSDAELPADVLIWDEAHHAVASTFREVSARYPAAFHLGLTATPERADRTGLGDVFQRLVAPVSLPELIAAGHLVPCDVIGPSRVTDTLSMDPADAVERFSKGRQTVVFASNRAECEEITDALNARGIRSAFVDGKMPVRRREEALASFAAKTIQVIVNVYVLTEGWDVPETAVCVLARKCGATGTFLQMVGRVLRPAPGKERALLVDLCGVVHQHGLPDEAREYSLDGKPIKTAEARLALRQCPDCGGVDKPRPICDRCGFKFPPPKRREVEATELARVNVPPRAQLIKEWEALVLAARSRKTRDGKPYSPKWAALRFKEQFGFWPPRNFPRAHEVAA